MVDHQAHEFLPFGEGESGQPGLDVLGERRQAMLDRLLVPRGGALRFQAAPFLLQAMAMVFHGRLSAGEGREVHQARLVGIEQSGRLVQELLLAPGHLSEARAQGALIELAAVAPGLLIRPGQGGGVFQMPAHGGPHKGVQLRRPRPALRAQVIILERIRALAGIVVVHGPVGPLHALTRHRPPAAAADEAAQEPVLLAEPPRAEAAVVPVDGLGAGEERRVDERRDGQPDPFLARPDPGARPGLLPPPAGNRRQGGVASIVGEAPDVGLVVEDAIDRARAPAPLPGGTRQLLLGQPPGDAPGREPLLDVPAEDRAHPARGRLGDLDRGGERPLARRAPVPIRHAPEQRLALAEPEELPAPVTLGDLGPFVFGHDALDLDEELGLGVGRRRVLAEVHGDVPAAQLFHDQDLVGIAAGQAVRAEHDHGVEGPERGAVAQAIQAGAIEPGAAVAFVHAHVLLADRELVRLGVRPDGRQLGGHRPPLFLLLAGHPRVKRDPDHPLTSWRAPRSTGPRHKYRTTSPRAWA